MRVYSQALGKVIDKPDNAAPSLSGGNDSVAQLKKLYALQILKAAKKPADIVTAFSLLEPSASEIKAQQTQKTVNTEKNNSLSSIDQALKLLQGGGGQKPINTNPLAGIVMGIKAKFGLGSPQERQLYNLLSDIKAQKMFSVGGKALTGPEQAILAPIVPSPSYGTATNITNLQEFRNKLAGIYDNYQAPVDMGTQDINNQYQDNGDFIPQ